MEIGWTDQRIELEKELNALDQFVIDFCAVLDKASVRFVICSGYVAILFGRNRSSEDVDMFIQRLAPDGFEKLWTPLNASFDCLNASTAKDAHELLRDGLAVRFAHKGSVLPNMEVKFPKHALDDWTLEERREVLLNKHTLFISPPEMQIAFKISLGSEKDIEDARYLHSLLREWIDEKLLSEMCRKLKVERQLKLYL